MSGPSHGWGVRVVGCGRPCGDDAVGWMVVERLAAEGALSDRVELARVEGGDALLDLLDGRGALIVVDAVRSGAPPGTLHRFVWPDAGLSVPPSASTHDLGVAAALALAGVLGLLPRRTVVLGVEIGATDPGTALDPALAARVPALVAAVRAEIAAAMPAAPHGA